MNAVTLGQPVFFYAPGLKHYETDEFAPQQANRFVSLSLTGSQCALRCDHCNARLLESMLATNTPELLWQTCSGLAANGTRGVLITGGCNPHGQMDFRRFAPILKRIKRELGLDLVIHTGLLDETAAKLLAEIGVDGAMLDLIGSKDTIHNVYHLDAEVSAYERSLRYLMQYDIRALPHIVLGLDYGRVVGEDRALEIVVQYPVSVLVLVILTPLDGTPMAAVESLPLDDVERLFRKARRILPAAPITLGCARPYGAIRLAIDKLAIDCGLNGIAYPTDGTVAYAQERGLRPVFREECCSLIFRECK